jgi:glycogen operon protein
MGRTQQGNNNAYCQDGEISWLHWDLADRDREFLEYTRGLIAFVKAHPVFRRRSFLQGRQIRGVRDVTWYSPAGTEMTDDEWRQGYARCFGMYLSGDAIGESDERGRPIVDESFLMLLNAHHEELPFVLPEPRLGSAWRRVLDTADPHTTQTRTNGGERYALPGRALVVLQEEIASNE